MAKFTPFIYIFLLAIALRCATSARILDEFDQQQPSLLPTNPTVVPPGGTAPTLPTAQLPATADDNNDDQVVADPPVLPEDPATLAAPGAPGGGAPGAPGTGGVATTNPSATVAVPVTGPTAALPAGGAGAIQAGASAATSANSGTQGEANLSFFIHDIVGGSHPSSRTVTGIIATTEMNGIPFSKVSNNFFPLTGGTPLLNNNLNNIVNTQNLPFLTGLNGAQSTTILQNSGNNNIVSGGNNNQAFVTAGQLPGGASLQQLMFGSITVIDDELTEGNELGSAILGRAQGLYLASSMDGTSQTIALTVLLHGGEHEAVDDTISFFGVHRTASPESQVAVIGGTGKYENARGYATLETLPMEDQHITDGVDTILHFSVYLTE
ncbi:hypothetical protein ACFE04_004008 [Oxalis oulophora]